MRPELCIVLILLSCLPSGAQEHAAEFRGRVGEELCVGVALFNPAGQVEPGALLSGRLVLSNSSVFYPKALLPDGELLRENDSLYRFTLAPGEQTGDTLKLQLCGEALAGNDSLCDIRVFDIRINGTRLDSQNVRVITESVGAPLPYVRFAELDTPFPHPLPSGASTTWTYRIDKPSEITLILVTLTGEEYPIHEPGQRERGEYTFVYSPDARLAAGTYWVKLSTNSGVVFKPLVVTK